MITKEYADGLAEVLVILDNTDQEYVNKIPPKIRNFFVENASKDYMPKVNPNQEIKDMNLKSETKHILSVIYLNYWAENQDEKKQFNQILKENQTLVDSEIREKYNPNNIFENAEKASVFTEAKQIQDETPQQNEALIPYEENLFTKIFSRIKEFLKKLLKR